MPPPHGGAAAQRLGHLALYERERRGVITAAKEKVPRTLQVAPVVGGGLGRRRTHVTVALGQFFGRVDGQRHEDDPAHLPRPLEGQLQARERAGVLPSCLAIVRIPSDEQT